jgi:hypothetical protein
MAGRKAIMKRKRAVRIKRAVGIQAQANPTANQEEPAANTTAAIPNHR